MRKAVTFIVVTSLASLFAFCLGGNSREISGFPIVWFLVAYSLAVQVIVFIPALIYNTEKYYDLTGSFTFFSITLISLLTNPHLVTKQVIAGAMVCIWCLRLGYFLFTRILKAGEDSRFVAIKKTKLRFFYAWFIQGLWVVVTSGPLLAILTTNVQLSNSFNLIQMSGIAIWLTGIILQSVSDYQKSLFNSRPQNKGRFVNVGLWSYSRHPNYVGQIVLWTGATLFAFSSLQGGQYLTLICPIFVYLLLTKLSGVPMLQTKAEERWGKDQSYISYKENTPVLFPFISSPKVNRD